MKNEMPRLQYAFNELEPIISAETLEYHYGKHLQTYVGNLAKLVKGTEYETRDIEEIVATAPDGGIFNNAGQVLNHVLYFLQFSAPNHDSLPEGRLAGIIDRDFGNLEALKAKMEEAAINLFGSGWAWLSLDNDGKLQITQESNAGNPIRRGHKPLLCFDVWEHAYYIDYRNRRADYVKQLWNIINWQEISLRL